MDEKSQQGEEQCERACHKPDLTVQRRRRCGCFWLAFAYRGKTFFLAGNDAPLNNAHIGEARFGKFGGGCFGACSAAAQDKNGGVFKGATAQGCIAGVKLRYRGKSRGRGKALFRIFHWSAHIHNEGLFQVHTV